MAIDNFDKISHILKWNHSGDYYFVQLILRKKDKATTYGNKNNSSRLIKSYYFFDINEFVSKRSEIKALCDMFKCRAGINLNVRNEEKLAYEILTKLSERIKTKNFRGINGLLNTANGSLSSNDKVWLIDIDNKDEQHLNEVIQFINDSCKPYGNDSKVLSVLPTYNGFHLVCNRFDKIKFKSKYPLVDIHQNNPFALYYPDIE